MSGTEDMDLEVEVAPEVEIPVDTHIQIAQIRHEMAVTNDAGKLEGLKEKVASMEKEEKEKAGSLEELQEKKEDAVKNLGSMEVRDACLAIITYYDRIDDREKTLECIEDLIGQKKVVGVGPKLDLLFHRIRLGLSTEDLSLVKDNLEEATEILKKESDWERRNRLKIYEGLYCIWVRRWERAAELLLDAVATFSAYELMSYSQFVYYLIFTTIIHLPRPDLKKKVIDNPEIRSTLIQVPVMAALLEATYDCDYAKYLDCLAAVCEGIEENFFLHRHTNFFYRAVRVLIFKQYMASYQTVGLEKMAGDFSIEPALLERQLASLISSNRLDCRLDKVAGQIITRKHSKRNASHLQVIERGDLLLSKITKLSRVVGI